MGMVAAAALARVLHDLFTVVWIGGLFTMALTVMPMGRKVLGEGPQLKMLMAPMQLRMNKVALISIAVLLASGIILARSSSNFTGLFSFANTYSSLLAVKHLLFVAMIVITSYQGLAARKESGKPDPGEEKRRKALFAVNLLLGMVTVVLSSLTSIMR